MFDKVKLSLMVVGRILGLHCMHCMLSLLKYIFKAYKDFTSFCVLL